MRGRADRPMFATVLDGLVEQGSLFLRLNSQFLFQNLCTLSVLAQSGRPLAGLDVELHQEAVGRLVHGINRQPAPAAGYSHLGHSLGTMATRQSLERAAQFSAEALALERLPVVECGAVTQRETGHKVVAIQGSCLLQRGKAGQTHLARWVAVCSARGQKATKSVHVEPEVIVAWKG